MRVLPSLPDAALSGSSSALRDDFRWRLTIGQLLLWMATTGAVLAFLQAFDAEHSRPHGAGGGATFKLDWLVHRLFAPAYGAALAGTIIVVRRQTAGRLGSGMEPGHWLLTILAAWTACLTVFVVSAESALAAGPAVALMLGSGALAVLATATGFAAWRQRQPGTDLWYAAFLLQSIVYGGLAASTLLAAVAGENWPLLFWMAMGFLLLGGSMLLLSGLITLLAILDDLAETRDRDGLHWIGVGCLLCIGSHPLILLMGQGVVLG